MWLDHGGLYLTEAKQASFVLSEIWDTLVLEGGGGRHKWTGV